MADQYKLRVPPSPEYQNSAGRLLRLLQMFNSPNAAYYETVATFFDGKEAPTIEVKGELYLEFMHLLSSAYQEFISDIEAADTIGKPAKQVLKDGLSKLPQIIYPINMGNVPRQLQDAEIVSLRMAGSMLAQEEN